ncbi:putative ankyrin repeat protein [Phytophthora citrophthora]|uniref:Ankyrin repeat protein n=1 Tax=Phytophthora citrophthora TaxID=4793 RepID=A0AAD9G891_9STRA|nr:putative ankyrin repeat protein [Phytophthora citrophthora]
MTPAPLTSVVVVTRSQPGIAELSHVTDTLSAFLDCSSSLPLSRASAVGSVSLLQRIWDASKSSETIADSWCQPTNTWRPAKMLWTNQFYYQDQFAKGMIEACKHADVDTVQWLVDQFTNCVVPAQAVEAAAQRGKRDILQVLVNIHEDYKKASMPGARVLADKKPHQVTLWESNVLLAAASGGHGDLVIWLYTDVFHGFYMNSNQEVMDELARHGDFTAVRRLVADGWQPPRIDYAAEGGSLDMVQWLLDQHRDVGKQWALKNAAARGYLEIVQLLVNEGIVYLDGEAFCDAASNGHLSVVQWLRENNLGWSLAYKAMDLAASNGHLEIGQYLHSHCGATCTHRTMRGAATNGHLQIVEWLHAQFGDNPSVDLYEAGSKQQYNTTVMDVAAMNGHLHVLKYLHRVALAMETIAMVELGKTVPTCTMAAIQFAAAHGHLEVLKWLHDNYWMEPSVDVVDIAAASGNLDMVKWLCEHSTAKFSPAALDAAAREGHLAVLQWLDEHVREGCTVKAMDEAAAMGHLDTVQWLSENRTEGCSPKALDGASAGGHFDVVLLLATRYPELGSRADMGGFIENSHIKTWMEAAYH